MSNNEAKFLLGAYRANGRDAEDALFGAALAQARADPVLGAWFARAQTHDAAIAGKLRAVTPPAGLREAILTGARASTAKRSRWLSPAPWLALAAGVAVLLSATVALWPKRAAADAAHFSAFAIEDTAHERHGGHGAASGALQAVLGQPANRLGAGLAVNFAQLKATGCRTVSFAGHDVLEVCFQRDGRWFHCYIGRRSDFPTLRANPTFTERAQLASAAWADAGHVFVVVGDSGLEAVKRLL